ncbi:MAG: indole-3-glycerol phosphate synthase TrpC [Chloroflexi bacterium]|nr:indole-3-glycerol phosphate synthase TrpC [Chloroflexota bacterium]
MSAFTATGTILDKIMAHKAEEIAAAKSRRPVRELQAQLVDVAHPRDFIGALRRDTVALIAEVKKASPSKGVFVENFDPVDIATTYFQNGAAAISVLTDEQFFQGHLDYLTQVKQVVGLPVLRKEFVIDAYQVTEARVAGADAVLLIVACLSDAQLADLQAQIVALGMAALIEVHDEAEMERALALQSRLIGVNNRNLHNFHVDLQTTIRLAALCPPEITLVGESGIHQIADIETLAHAGVHAILVGESLILADDRAAKVRELSGVVR